jgi:uncharacterized membrane protein
MSEGTRPPERPEGEAPRDADAPDAPPSGQQRPTPPGPGAPGPGAAPPGEQWTPPPGTPPPPPPSGTGGWGAPPGGGYGPPPGSEPPPGYGPPPGSGQQPPPGWGAPPGQSWQQGGQPPGQAESGLSQNVASGLSYLLTFITGIIFLLTDKRLEVRFHAAQSILFGILWAVIGFLSQAITGPGPIDLLLGLAWIAMFVLWIVLMIQAFQGNHFKLPVIGDLAEQQVARPM